MRGEAVADGCRAGRWFLMRPFSSVAAHLCGRSLARSGVSHPTRVHSAPPELETPPPPGQQRVPVRTAHRLPGVCSCLQPHICRRSVVKTHSCPVRCRVVVGIATLCSGACLGGAMLSNPTSLTLVSTLSPPTLGGMDRHDPQSVGKQRCGPGAGRAWCVACVAWIVASASHFGA